MRLLRNGQRSRQAQETAQGGQGAFTLPSRRGLITGLAALIAAPALVQASSLMPISTLPAEDGVYVVSRAFVRLSWVLMRTTGSDDWEFARAQSDFSEAMAKHPDALGRYFEQIASLPPQGRA